MQMIVKNTESLRAFIRMYNPHEAREDTVLFPGFRKIVSGHEYDSLGEDFEKTRIPQKIELGTQTRIRPRREQL